MPCHFNFQGYLPWARIDDQRIHERSHGHWSQVAGRVCPKIFPLQRPHETQQAKETAEDRAFIQQIRGSKLMENLASFQEISHKSHLLRISLCYFFFWMFHMYICRYVYTFQRNFYFDTNDGQWILFKFTWLLSTTTSTTMHYYNASWSKLVHVLSPVGTIVCDGHLIWDLSIPMQCLFTNCMKVLKSENVFMCTREHLEKKSAGHGCIPYIPDVLKICTLIFFYHVCQFLMVIC